MRWNFPFANTTPRGGKKVYFTFLLYMDRKFNTWHPIAKDRFVTHFQRYHASDTYQGNIDVNARATGWDNKYVFGEGSFIIPEEWLENFTTITDLKEIAEDFLGNIIRYDLSPTEKQVIKKYTVKIQK